MTLGDPTGLCPIATAAVRAHSPEARWAESQCDKAREKRSFVAPFAIGNFTGNGRTEPGKRYKGTSYELLYQKKVLGVVLSTYICHIIVNVAHGRYVATHGPHFRPAPEAGLPEIIV
jgi:hypothetical protein